MEEDLYTWNPVEITNPSFRLVPYVAPDPPIHERMLAWTTRLRPRRRDEVCHTPDYLPYYFSNFEPTNLHTCVFSPQPEILFSHLVMMEDGVYDWTPVGMLSFPIVFVGTNPIKGIPTGGAGDSIMLSEFDLKRPFRIVQSPDVYTITQDKQEVTFSRNDRGRSNRSLYITFTGISYQVQYTEKN